MVGLLLLFPAVWVMERVIVSKEKYGGLVAIAVRAVHNWWWRWDALSGSSNVAGIAAKEKGKRLATRNGTGLVGEIGRTTNLS